MRVSLRSLAFALCPLALSTALPAAPPPSPTGASDSMFADGFARMFEHLGGFDWDAEAERAAQAAELLWERNGWTDESDIFARDLACEVTRIPPWEVIARLELLTNRVAERYGLSGEQATDLRRSMVREAAGFLGKNNRVLLEYGTEAMVARAQGKPYTPQQVQRWATAIEPLLADADASLDRLSKEIEPALSPEKKDLFQRDLSAFEKRAKYVDEKSRQWAQGQWKPEDWGLENDPIQSGRLAQPAPAVPTANSPIPEMTLPEPQLAAPSPEPFTSAIPSNWMVHEPQTWIAYVVFIEKRFRLDAGQRSAAGSIHAELVTRAADYISAHRAELSSVAQSDRANHALYEPVRTLFAELQQRLDALPTTVQRDAAGHK